MSIAYLFFYYTIITLSIFWLTFVFLNAVLHLRTARDSGYLKIAPAIVRAFAYLALGIGLVLDTALNVMLSIVFWELPQEFLTTKRVIRLKRQGNDWQKSCSNWLCKQLNALDSNHCG
jgi:hypothetical protein